jgi:hypothetical protein
MAWASFDDQYTRQPVWDDLPYDTRWHFHAIVEACCAQRRYDGVLRWAAVARCSDVPDPERCTKELIEAGLLADLGAEVQVLDIDAFLPPRGERKEHLLPRKRVNQADYRQRKCEKGEHSKDCPPSTCPVKLARRVTGGVTGNAGSGRGSPVGAPTEPTSVKAPPRAKSARGNPVDPQSQPEVEGSNPPREKQQRREAGDQPGRSSTYTQSPVEEEYDDPDDGPAGPYPVPDDW